MNASGTETTNVGGERGASIVVRSHVTALLWPWLGEVQENVMAATFNNLTFARYTGRFGHMVATCPLSMALNERE